MVAKVRTRVTKLLSCQPPSLSLSKGKGDRPLSAAPCSFPSSHSFSKDVVRWWWWWFPRTCEYGSVVFFIKVESRTGEYLSLRRRSFGIGFGSCFSFFSEIGRVTVAQGSFLKCSRKVRRGELKTCRRFPSGRIIRTKCFTRRITTRRIT